MSTTDQLRNAVTPAKAQAVATASRDLPTTINGWLRHKKFKDSLALALPKAMTPERFIRIVMTECKKAPKLMECNTESFLGAALQCAQLGLEPGSALGHCYLLPFGSGRAKDGKLNCQLIIGYRGMIDLARRSGQILSICAYCVYEKDKFELRLGLDPSIEHVPSAEANPGKMVYVYAVAKLRGGGVQFEAMSRSQIEAVRKTSKSGDKGPWVDHFDEMAKKTVIRRLFKYLPVSIEAARAVEIDERSDRGEAATPQDFIDATFVDLGTEVPPEAVTLVDGTTGEIVEDVPPVPEE